MASENQIEIIGKALITAIPWIGGSITSVWSDISQERKNRRVIEFIEGLKTELEERIDEIDAQKVNANDIQDLFENTLEAIIKNRHIEKRIALRHILVNTLVKSGNGFDEAEMFSDLIIRLPIFHLIIFYEIGNRKFEKTTDETCQELINSLLVKYPVDIDDLMEAIIDLENENLVNRLSSSYATSYGSAGFSLYDAQSYVTKKGKKFQEYIDS